MSRRLAGAKNRDVRSPSRFPCLSIALALVLAAGCATQADIQDIRREHRGIRSQLANTRASLDGLQREVAELRGRVDEVRQSSRGGRKVESGLSDLEARVAALELERRPQLQPGSSGGPLAQSDQPGPTEPERRELAVTDLAREEARPDAPEEYRRGLALARQGGCDRAIQVFREFLRTHPDSPYTPNAHYWIGDCHYVLGDYSQAILKFNDVRQQYPKSDRAAPALLKIGLAFLEMGNKSEARLAFQKVVNDYPSLPEAAKAREKLQALGT